LELVRARIVSVKQSKEFGEIVINKV